MNNKFVYLSHFLSDNTPTYGDRDNFSIKKNSSIESGDTANSFKMRFTTNHLGTHVDLPFHFYSTGKKIEDVEPAFWVFKHIAIIEIPCSDNYLITPEDIAKHDIDHESEIILIKTGYEKFRNDKKYWKSNPGILPEVASYIRERYIHVRAIGFDFISLTSFQNRSVGKEAHKAFLIQKKIL